MSKKLLWFPMVFCVVTIIMLAGCLREDSKKDIKIGVISALSGEFAAVGENFVKGIEVAKNLYQASNPDIKITLIKEDDRFDTKTGITAYKKLASVDNVDAFINLSTPTIDAVYEDVIRANKPFMQLGIQTNGLGKDNIFQMSPPPELPIYRLAEHINKSYSYSNIAVVYDDSTSGNLFFKAFESKYSGNHNDFKIGNKDILKDYATKIVKEKYPAVVFMTGPENASLLIKNIHTLTKELPFFFFDANLHTGFDNYKRILGDTNLINGSITVWAKEGETQELKQKYKEIYNEEPGFLADFGFDSFNTLINAYNKNTSVWIDTIKKTDNIGASGGILFDENGVRNQPLDICVVKNGEIEILSE